MSSAAESNTKATSILLTLVLVSLAIFFAERKFLVAEKRGETISHYENVSWVKQVKLLVEDFEGISHDSILSRERIFCYGSSKVHLIANTDKSPVAGENAVKITWDSTQTYGGWGKGVGANIDLSREADYINFRIRIPGNGSNDEVKVTLEEDDNNDGKLQKDKDDAWSASVNVKSDGNWQMISIPLKNFNDDNAGGDHAMNIDRKGGLHTIIFSFMKPALYNKNSTWFFDFIFFSNGKIPS